jgi:hypothetical protein
MKSRASSFLKSPCSSRLQKQGVMPRLRRLATKKNTNHTRESASQRRVSDIESILEKVTDSKDH